MKKASILVLVLAVCVCAFFMVADVSRAQGVNGLQAKGPAAGPRGLIPSGNVKVDVDFAKVPLYFIANRGQVNEQARFYARARRYTLWLTREGLVFDGIKKQDPPITPHQSPLYQSTPHRSPTTKHERDVSRLMFIGANPNPEMKAVKPAALKVNYFTGNDRSKWNCDVPTSLAVQYGNLYKNIDLQVYGIEKQIEYDWLVRPGGDPAAIRFAYKDIKGSRIDKDGNLVIETRFGELMHKKPIGYQVIDSKKQAVDVTFKKTGKDSFGFSVGQYDQGYDLIIDPLVLVYSTYLGGEYPDFGYSIAVDGSGHAYVTGLTYSTDFPTLNQYQADQGDIDAFVTKLDPSQSGTAGLLYSAYLGGGDVDIGYGIAVDGSGHAYVTGYTDSTDFPSLNQYQADKGGSDVFVAKLDPSQSGAAGLLYSTILGGGDNDYGSGMAVDDSGHAYVTGYTYSTDFPTLHQFQSFQGVYDLFIAKLDPSQSGTAGLLYSTYLGGGDEDEGYGIAVDGSGHVYVTGCTYSTDFPTLHQYQAYKKEKWDIFVAKLDPSQSGAAGLLYSTYLGGGDTDIGYGIAVDGSGYAYVTGDTHSTDFPTLHQYQADQGSEDVIIAKLDPSQSGASSLLYSTYLGGGDADIGYGIAVDGSGYAYVTGCTYSWNFPTRDPSQAYQGGRDVFVAKLAPSQSGTAGLLYSTYLGRGDDDEGQGIAVDGTGNAYVTGSTDSTDFPTLNQYQANQGYWDVFVAKLSFGTPPTVDSPFSALVTYTTAELGGNVSSTNDSNVTERGVYWSTTDGFTPHVQGTKVSETGDWGTGIFVVYVTGLPPGTPIYFRAFAANNSGTGYTAQDSFTTLVVTAPEVTTAAISNVTFTSADSGGDVTSDGGAPVTARGVCWGTSVDPTTTGSHTTDGPGTGTFTSHITGITPGTAYHVRAYATNSVGTAYGSDVGFTTLGIGVTSPNGGENWKLSSSQNITWNAAGITGLLKITLWKNGILVGTIANNIAPAAGSYAWTAGKLSNGSMVAPGADYTIKIKETGTAIADSSDANFTLSPGITVTAPNGGQTWTIGNVKQITWRSGGLTNQIKISLWKDNVLVGTIATVAPAGSPYAWTVGSYTGGTAAAGSGYTIKIKEIGTTVTDTSDGTITLIN